MRGRGRPAPLVEHGTFFNLYTVLAPKMFHHIRGTSSITRNTFVTAVTLCRTVILFDKMKPNLRAPAAALHDGEQLAVQKERGSARGGGRRSCACAFSRNYCVRRGTFLGIGKQNRN